LTCICVISPILTHEQASGAVGTETVIPQPVTMLRMLAERLSERPDNGKKTSKEHHLHALVRARRGMLGNLVVHKC
jgi:hypothetical protein